MAGAVSVWTPTVSAATGVREEEDNAGVAGGSPAAQPAGGGPQPAGAVAGGGTRSVPAGAGPLHGGGGGHPGQFRPASGPGAGAAGAGVHRIPQRA
ncbi:protein of unknown function [Candidatus Hydrogenisulfobacillus filiaventi]|uniref:Uncharacterized protein n=1 Tax=Candidatus Hydrogenisulfobacillus filiaventi TaxID=2707344 RepID=A0A6F8ZHH6_9FIRM|nr:protein of unknown function [Candidatus Hydrogenisulfobacillus filiaventi]